MSEKTTDVLKEISDLPNNEQDDMLADMQVTKKEREKIAPEVLRITDELLK